MTHSATRPFRNVASTQPVPGLPGAGCSADLQRSALGTCSGPAWLEHAILLDDHSQRAAAYESEVGTRRRRVAHHVGRNIAQERPIARSDNSLR